MVEPSMIMILGTRVEILLTLVTRILNQSRKVFAFHMPLKIVLCWAHISTDIALEPSRVDSLTDLFNVVVQVKPEVNISPERIFLHRPKNLAMHACCVAILLHGPKQKQIFCKIIALFYFSSLQVIQELQGGRWPVGFATLSTATCLSKLSTNRQLFTVLSTNYQPIIDITKETK